MIPREFDIYFAHVQHKPWILFFGNLDVCCLGMVLW